MSFIKSLQQSPENNLVFGPIFTLMEKSYKQAAKTFSFNFQTINAEKFF